MTELLQWRKKVSMHCKVLKRLSWWLNWEWHAAIREFGNIVSGALRLLSYESAFERPRTFQTGCQVLVRCRIQNCQTRLLVSLKTNSGLTRSESWTNQISPFILLSDFFATLLPNLGCFQQRSLRDHPPFGTLLPLFIKFDLTLGSVLLNGLIRDRLFVPLCFGFSLIGTVLSARRNFHLTLNAFSDQFGSARHLLSTILIKLLTLSLLSAVYCRISLCCSVTHHAHVQGGTGTLSPYIHLGGGAGQGRCKKVFIESIF